MSHHPFCGGEPDDTRITTRYNEGDFLESLFAVLHETGHALYQQGLPKAWRGQPVGDAGGMALHESQSLTMEMQVSRSAAFLEFAAPIVQRSLLGAPTRAAQWQPENLVALATRVRRGFIRVDADELTYPQHVILRYELETALLDGRLEVADLPDAWDEKMSAGLGLSTAGDFANGCMQDVHWFAGLIGYFPTYTLGAVIAAQLYRAAREQVAGLEDAIRAGDFPVLVDWLRDRVHRRGRLLPSMALVAEATGRAAWHCGIPGPLGPALRPDEVTGVAALEERRRRSGGMSSRRPPVRSRVQAATVRRALAIGCMASSGLAAAGEAKPLPSAADAAIPEAQDVLGSPLDDADYAKSARCLFRGLYRRIEVLNDQVLVFHGRGERVWLNVLQRRCAGLRPDMILSLELRNMRICAHDQFRGVVRIGSDVSTPICILGEFAPVSPDNIHAMRDALMARQRNRTVEKTVRSAGRLPD